MNMEDEIVQYVCIFSETVCANETICYRYENG